MKGMGEDVVEDERRRADGGVSVGKMHLRIAVEVLLAEARKVVQRSEADFALELAGFGDGRVAGRVFVFEGELLEGVDPECFAVEDVDDLGAKAGEAEAGEFFRVVRCGDSREVIKDEGQARVGPVVELAHAGEGEHGALHSVVPFAVL